MNMAFSSKDSPRCWCGNPSLEPFSGPYLHCPNCESLVYTGNLDHLAPADQGSESFYYGKDYWFEHQEKDLGLPTIAERARMDLSERIPYLLRTVLKYRLPPARSLEVGCGHGGLAGLMRQAGFDAAGLELSPAIVEFAHQTFDIPMVLGPLEQQNLPAGAFDLILMIDVLEHLPDPPGTLREVRRLLKPDGLLFIQTPCYPAGRSYQQLQESESQFLQMLIPEEHLNLFSKDSVTRLLEDAGFQAPVFEPPFFPQYDMFLVAPVTSIHDRYSDEKIAEAMVQSSQSRTLLGLLDLKKTYEKTLGLLRESEEDRYHRLEVIHSRDQSLKDLDSRLQFTTSELQETTGKLQETTGKLRYTADQLQHVTAELKNFLDEAANGSPRKFDRSLYGTTTGGKPGAQRVNGHKRSRTIVIDLTPVRPGGENGGAKMLALELIRQFSKNVAPECKYVLLTSHDSHAELAALDAPNVERICINQPAPAPSSPVAAAPSRWKSLIRAGLEKALPHRLYMRVYHRYRATIHQPKSNSLLKGLGADLVFCPFTAPFFYDPQIPIVIIVLDLQYREYPIFFKSEDLYHTDHYFQQSVQVASRLICISEYTRKTVLEAVSIPPERAVAIPTSLYNPLKKVDADRREKLLEPLGLAEDTFMLYPANFWPHKNHAMLLTAFQIYRRRHPESRTKLVFTGAPGGQEQVLRDAACMMGLEKDVIFPGFVSTELFSALLLSCRALIFPSLYEGFGAPVLEGMAHGKPVLCSDLTSLPEVVGEAAILFDPRKPECIVEAIEAIDNDPDLRARYAALGLERAKAFSDPTGWARAYFDVFEEVWGQRVYATFQTGIHPDGWAGDEIEISYSASSLPQYLDLAIESPNWIPAWSTKLEIVQEKEVRFSRSIRRGTTSQWHFLLPEAGGTIILRISPALAPVSLKVNNDERVLGCHVVTCRLVRGEGVVDFLKLARGE
jgi:glycosyltransferase involved in cell wall biosynthesis/2-polyprenyl-3-methyl-5-hydroxy-6-metoxy-1,4-benzoquinol methylase